MGSISLNETACFFEMEKIWRDVEMKEQKFFVEDSMSDLLDILRAIIFAE